MWHNKKFGGCYQFAAKKVLRNRIEIENRSVHMLLIREPEIDSEMIKVTGVLSYI